MSMEQDKRLVAVLMKLDRLIESNQKLADAVAQQTMAIHALAASNEQIVDVLANAALEDAPADEGGEATSLDQIVGSLQNPRTL
jgi:uncharacterized protein YqcC (DUF446 family)